MTQHATNPDIRQLRHRLEGIRTRVRLVLIGHSVLRCSSILLGSIVALGYVDYLLHLPMGMRIVTLIGLVWLAWRCWARSVGPAAGLEVRISDIALEIEKREPMMRGLLAGAVDLDAQSGRAEYGPDGEIGRALRIAALASISRRLAGHRLPSILNLGDLGRALTVFVVLGLGIAVMQVQRADLVSIGLSRTLSPWTDARWPMRFAIHDTTERSPRAVDLAVPIRALIGSGASDEYSSAQTKLRWRVLDEQGRAISAWTQTALVDQHRRDSELDLPIYEQLIDAKSAIIGRDDLSFVLEYAISTRDDAIERQLITLVRPPELVETSIEISLPIYAEPIADSGAVRSGVIETSRSDAAISPILAGSQVKISWRFSKPIKMPSDTTPAWVLTLAQGNTIVGITQPEPSTIELALIARRSSSIEPGVVDEMGIMVRTPIILSLGVLDDQNPGASITEPARDEVVSTHAIIKLAAELSDDFGLARGSIIITRARMPGGSSGGPHEPIDEGIKPVDRAVDAQTRVMLEATLDLGSLEIEPGDQVWIQAIAWDLQHESAPETKAPTLGMTKSTIRVLDVVGDSELIEGIQTGLGSIRQALRQIDDQQSHIQSLLRNGELETNLNVISRDQQALTGRLSASGRTIGQLRDSMGRNQLDDPALESLLNDAGSILQEARESSARASDQIDRGEREQAGANQRVVRDRVGELLSMLDRGQDAWLALRAIEQLRDELSALRDATGRLNEQAAGKTLDQLDAEEQSTLQRILERQMGLAQDANDALATLDEQSEQLEAHDPTQAQALRQAAAQGRRAQIEDKLKEAGEQIASNQTSSATQTQSAVLDELDKMLEELENTIKNRDNALRRALASIIDSIKVLITTQEKEIERVNEPGTDDRLITLVGNTLAVRDLAIGAFPETRSIADLITQAGNAQSNAINALRSSPMDTDQAQRFERTSLLSLHSALEEADRLDEQAASRQARRERAQLRDAYRQALDIQSALRDESSMLVGQKLNRRQRASARALGEGQEEIRRTLGELLEETQELSDAPVFAMAHGQLDRLMAQSADGLSSRIIESRVIDAQRSSMMILSTLVEVLSDSPNDQESEDFDDGSQGGSSGDSGSSKDEPVIPPIAQLKLLRSMQQLATMQTRAFAENPSLTNQADIEALSDLQRQLFEHGRRLIEDMSPNRSPEPVVDTDEDRDGDVVEPIDPVEDGER